MKYKITRKGWEALVASVFFVLQGTEIFILFNLGLSTAPGRFDLDHWIMGLIITTKALVILGYLLILRRLHR